MALRAAARAVLAAAAFWAAGGVSVDVENGVYKLEESNFESALGKFPLLMVKFYAPWCGHCKALSPKYERAAKKLRKRNATDVPRLAKVDATAQAELAKRYDVQGYPTLLVFKDGKLFEAYNGGRTRDEIIDYLDTFAAPAPLDAAMRGYYRLSGPYKETMRVLIPFRIPRQITYYLFPVLLGSPVLLPLLCLLCCRGGKKKPAKPNGAAQDKEEKKEEDAPAEAAEDKEEESKKDD